MPTRANALAVMAKAPIPGTVKTRLKPLLSAEEAAELARALLVDQLEHLCALEAADLYLAFTPPDGGALMTQLKPVRFEIFPQSDGDLGERMGHVFEKLFAKDYKKVILIGGDLAPVPLAYFAQAFAYLDSSEHRVVLGPSRDGGYYLIGLNQRLTELFNNMTWSHDQVMAGTLSKLGALGILALQLPSWFDIDTPADLQGLALRLQTSPDCAGKYTLQMLRRLQVGRRLSADK
jgi:uncharacterized protein